MPEGIWVAPVVLGVGGGGHDAVVLHSPGLCEFVGVVAGAAPVCNTLCRSGAHCRW